MYAQYKESKGTYIHAKKAKNRCTGACNEPTKAEMDELIKVLGGWFDGEITLTQKQQLTWLLNLIRKNALAVTALGGTIL